MRVEPISPVYGCRFNLRNYPNEGKERYKQKSRRVKRKEQYPEKGGLIDLVI